MFTIQRELRKTGYVRMNDLPKLADAINETFMQGLAGEKWWPKNGVTYCNEAVNYVAERMGYKKFRGLFANEIYDALQTNGDWHDVTPEASQYHANSGALVVAAWKNPEGHGHVCIVCPGVGEMSETWGYVAPKVLNIGQTNFIGKKCSWAFSADHRPKFYALKSMI